MEAKQSHIYISRVQYCGSLEEQEKFNAEAERRAKIAEAAPDLAKALQDSLRMVEWYADFIRMNQPPVELHPYFPDLESAIEESRSALRKAGLMK